MGITREITMDIYLILGAFLRNVHYCKMWRAQVAGSLSSELPAPRPVQPALQQR